MKSLLYLGISSLDAGDEDAAAAAVVLIVRTVLEDRMLQSELPGYAEYAKRTRYRLIPGVW